MCQYVYKIVQILNLQYSVLSLWDFHTPHAWLKGDVLLSKNLVAFDSKKYIIAGVLIVSIISASTLIFLNWIPPGPHEGDPTTTPTQPYDYELPEIEVPQYIMTWPDNFSHFTAYENDYDLNAPQYELESDLSNILNIESFRNKQGWSSEVESLIKQNYFAAVQNCHFTSDVLDRPYQQFSEVYEDNYWHNTPSFVTSDSMFHIFHVLYDYALRTMEQDNLTLYLDALIGHLLENSIKYHSVLNDPWWREIAKLNIAFFSVVMKCLHPDWGVPSDVSEWVNDTMQLIEESEGFSENWFMNQREDFSQFKPRGHYTKTPELERFFKAMMFLGRVNFRLHPDDDWRNDDENDQKGLDETAQALLISYALNDSSSLLEDGHGMILWKAIFLPTAFFVGECDDLTPIEYLDLMNVIYGFGHSVVDLESETQLTLFRDSADELRNPRMLSDWMWYEEEMEDVTKGMGVMSQRFVPDSYMFWQLVFPNVGNLGFPRLFPKGLDVMCALGSERAEELLESETIFENYTIQMNKLKDEFSSLPFQQWIQNLYWLWLYSLKPILSQPEEGRPSFMLTEAWLDKQLVTSLGTWTELRHDTVLYAKQSYTGYFSSPNPPPGYVEPVPRVYARLASLCKMLLDGLQGFSFISVNLEEKLLTLHKTLLSLETIARKELSSLPLNETEIGFTKGIGYILRKLERVDEDVDRAALVVDVHTDPNSRRVLEEATGDPMVIFVAVPYPNGSVYLTRGAIYSHYEFTMPMSNRLTDEEWWTLMDSPDCPDMSDWAGSLVAGSSALDYSFSSILNVEYYHSQNILSNINKRKQNVMVCRNPLPNSCSYESKNRVLSYKKFLSWFFSQIPR